MDGGSGVMPMGKHTRVNDELVEYILRLRRKKVAQPEIAGLTGASPNAVERILRAHLPRDERLAISAEVRSREVTATKRGGVRVREDDKAANWVMTEWLSRGW